MMKLVTKSALLVILIIGVASADDEQETTDYDDDNSVIPFTHLCKFDQPMLNHSTADDEDFCDCDVVTSSLGGGGRPGVKIDCEHSDHVTNLTNKIFQAQKLPVNTLSLILSYQHFREVPEFVGDQLELLDMSNNFITIVKSSNFIRVTSLKHLDLSYNAIEKIEPQAFEQLQFLLHLDLTSNQIVTLPASVFKPLVALETLKLSNNEGFGGNMQHSFHTQLYWHLNDLPKLTTIAVERCNLTGINLGEGKALTSINLAFNNISDFSKVYLPSYVESLDLSGNPVWEFSAKSLPHLPKLRELFLRDLPHLYSIDEYSLFGYPQLYHLSFEASKNLSSLHPHAFGENAIQDVDAKPESLKIVNLRGCNFRTLDSSLQAIFSQLDELHLEGNPFNCNCDVKWIKYLAIETNLRCHKPEVLHDKLLSSEVPEKKMKCENLLLRKFLNTLVLLLLLIACSLTIWFFLSRLNPSRKNKLQKIGPDSPYQRVTIEPNRAEYSVY